jgi:hypothetical protein
MSVNNCGISIADFAAASHLIVDKHCISCKLPVGDHSSGNYFSA